MKNLAFFSLRFFPIILVILPIILLILPINARNCSYYEPRNDVYIVL